MGHNNKNKQQHSQEMAKIKLEAKMVSPTVAHIRLVDGLQRRAYCTTRRNWTLNIGMRVSVVVAARQCCVFAIIAIDTRGCARAARRDVRALADFHAKRKGHS